MRCSAVLGDFLLFGNRLKMNAKPITVQWSLYLHCHRAPLTPQSLYFVCMNYHVIKYRSSHGRRIRSKLVFSMSDGISASLLNCDRLDDKKLVLSSRNDVPHLPDQSSANYGRYAFDDYSENNSDKEDDDSPAFSSTSSNVDDWKWKLSRLVRNKDEQEIVTREKKDRRDYEQLAALTSRMGLYSRQYAKVVVFSKVPLPNYRSDLDEKRPQRQVTIPSVLHRQVDCLLEAYLSRKPFAVETFLDDSSSRSGSSESIATDDGLNEHLYSQASASPVVQRALRQKNLQLHEQQKAWKESFEGKKMQEIRKQLPAYKERDALLKMMLENQVVVVSGETGCGKTTQIPQYILESEIDAMRGASCSIICTQPRRISAMTVSERVAAERGEKLGESVGYKVRLEGTKGPDTRLLFCTTGILLRRLQVDRRLRGVTHVIVDEIHERGMNEDFLLIVLKELLPYRPGLRLILMSATLNAELFSSYFGAAPVIHIPGFTYPVQSYFLESVLELTGYLLTSHNQIDDYGHDKMWKMQKQRDRKRKSQIASVVEDALKAADFKEYSRRTRESLACWNPDSVGFNLIETVLCYICRKGRPGAVLVFMMGWEDIHGLKEQLQAHPLLGDPSRVLVLTCHGSMASSEQRLIFGKPEAGVRKIVLATNMAETSITINDVVFVIDCGKAKETSYDALNNTTCLLPSWISKASVRQRRGRAGRVQPGECYHLYPRCVYEAFADYQLPELLRTPLQSLCLQIKCLRLGSISEFLSRALQPPEPLTVQNAVEYLKTIGALVGNENLTVLGHHLSMLPMDPKLGKMLIYGTIFNCLEPILTVVAGLSIRDPFLMPSSKKDLAESARSQFSARDFSDHIALVRAYDGWKIAENEENGYEYCWKNFLSMQTLRAIDSLRRQFFFSLRAAGLIDQNPETYNKWSQDKDLVRAVICAGLYPGVSSVLNKEKSILLKTMEDGQVLLYLNSVNGQESKIPYPWLVFNEKVKVNAVFLRDSTAVSDSALLLFGGGLSCGGLDGHLKMLGGHLEFFMKPTLANTYLRLKRELNKFIQMKLRNPKINTQMCEPLLSAVRMLVTADPCDGISVFGRQGMKSTDTEFQHLKGGKYSDGDNSKNQLQTMLARAGHEAAAYKVEQMKNAMFRACVEFNGMQFIGHPCSSKKLAEKDAAARALEWLTGSLPYGGDDMDRISMLVNSSKKKMPRRT